MMVRRISLACAILLAACAPTPKIANASGDLNQIAISKKSIQLVHGGDHRSFESCESADGYCFRSQGAVLIFPKRCPESIVEFYGKDPRFTFLGYVHGFVIAQPKGRKDLMFIYSEHLGVGAVYWDYTGSNSFIDRGPNLGVDMVAAEKFKFAATSANFACA